jgi:hypothetical protein
MVTASVGKYRRSPRFSSTPSDSELQKPTAVRWAIEVEIFLLSLGMRGALMRPPTVDRLVRISLLVSAPAGTAAMCRQATNPAYMLFGFLWKLEASWEKIHEQSIQETGGDVDI